MGSTSNESKPHMINWDICTLSRDKWGLGLTKVKDTNFALLTKWLWRYHKEPNSLWRKIDANYNKDFIGSIPITGKYCSLNAHWLAILQGKDRFDSKISCTINNGDSLSF